MIGVCCHFHKILHVPILTNIFEIKTTQLHVTHIFKSINLVINKEEENRNLSNLERRKTILTCVFNKLDRHLTLQKRGYRYVTLAIFTLSCVQSIEFNVKMLLN